MDQTVSQWLVWLLGIFVTTIIGLFLRRMYSKIETSISREEFNSALKALREEHQADRKELRDNQIDISAKLEFNNQLLTRVATKVEMLTAHLPFDKTWPPFKG